MTVEQELSKAVKERIAKLRKEERQVSDLADTAQNELDRHRYTLKSIRKEIEQWQRALILFGETATNSSWRGKSQSFSAGAKVGD